ncbi:MAG: SpaH/EbpB family LPXTG-anchored major pilin [Oscillospiraceae bacterium]|nr:SpaH/EbpB family LPXTG-anchored major pilin [Oscillospiraceae bacterium]
MKKLFSLTLVAMMLIALFAVPSFAAETGSITINNVAHADAVYSIYKVLDLESYDTASGAYSYKVDPAWTDFFKAGTGALDYVALDADGYVTWTAGTDDATVAAFAKLALAYAKTNSISPVKTTSNPSDFTKPTETSIKFSDLALGYYLLDSNVGALCGLTTTNPNAYVNAKNHIPIIDKQVQEDSTGNWGANNTADIGQVVNYRATISVHEGAENYVMHDKMSAGLTFNAVTSVVHIDPSTVPATETTLTEGVEYEVITTGITDGCTFEVRFSQAFCDSLDTNDKIVVSYNATLNESAIIAGEGNPNDVRLEFGEEHYTEWDQVKTYSFAFDLVKTDSQNKLISGAQFKIYNAATGGEEIKVVKVTEGGNTYYRLAKAGEEGVSIVVDGGLVRVVGLDNGDYYLEETVAPAGYNKLTSRVKFVIADANLDAIVIDGYISTGSGVQVVNKTGNMLPETGGLGTTLFVAIGGIAVLASGVLLFAKKRMSQIAE